MLAGRPLLLAHTSGHAKHHHCVWDAASRGWFTGDTFGLSYREFDTAQGAWIVPTSTPVQFEPEAMKQSIDRMLTRDPRAMLLTHYSRVTEAARLGADLHGRIDTLVALGREADAREDRHPWLQAALSEHMVGWALDHGCGLAPERVRELLATDIRLNAMGLESWLDRPKRKPAAS